MKNRNKFVAVLLLMVFGLLPVTINAQGFTIICDHIIPLNINGFAKDKIGNIYAGTSKGLYKSTDHGNRWVLVGLQGKSVWPICCDSNNHILACHDQSIFLSIDSGRNWVDKEVFLQSLTADKFGNIYGLGGNNHVEFWKSTDGGISWSMKLQTNGVGLDRIVADTMGNLFCTVSSFNSFPYISKSSDHGLTWTSYTFNNDWHQNWRSTALYVSANNILYVGASFTGIHTTNDTGATWSWPLLNGGKYIGSIISSDNDSTILATSSTDGYTKLITSFDGGKTWNYDKKLSWSSEYAAFHDPTLVRDTGNLIHLGVSSSVGIWDSYDFGQSWHQHPSGLSSLVSYCLAKDPQKGILFMGTSDGVYYSGSKGVSWLKLGTLTDGKDVRSIVVPKENSFVIVNNDSIRTSTDFGASWTSSLGGLRLGSQVVYDSITHSLFAYDSTGIFFKSVDAGLNWKSLGKIIPANDTLTAVAVRGRILIGTLHGLIRSSLDDGTTWTDLGSTISAPIYSLSINSRGIYIGAYQWLYSWDTVSNNWKRIDLGSGFNHTPLFIVENNQKEIFVFTDYGFLWSSHDGSHDGLNWRYLLMDSYIPFADFQLYDSTIFAVQSNTVLWSSHLMVGGFSSVRQNVQSCSVFPNPCDDRRSCYLSLPNVINPTIKLFTASGIEIPLVVLNLSNGNTYLLNWEPSLPSGMYSLQIMSKGIKILNKSLVITK